MSLSRREFLKGGLLAAAGATAAVLGGSGLFGRGSRRNGSGGEIKNIRTPRYLELEKSGELARREEALWGQLERCHLCPRKCGVNRAAGVKGLCSIADTFKVASHGPHHGEETPLVGRHGSGTIFFSNCNLLCVYCQNWQIAHQGEGRQTSHEQLAGMMLDMQRRGCHNINFVTPTHLTPHIVKALRIAIPRGLNLPILYNSSGYETLEVIKLLDGIIDIYLPDFKYQDAGVAARFSRRAPDYPLHTAAAIKEMYRQVGVLQQEGGLAYRGLIIRHLVLPENLAGTDKFARWVVDELGPETHVNIMGQYRPMFMAHNHPPLDRRVLPGEVAQAMRWAREAGLRNFH
jgi:putative pyruvate formate lyase activating enzyme